MLHILQQTFYLLFDIILLGTFNSLGDTFISFRNGGDNMNTKDFTILGLFLVIFFLLTIITIILI